MSIQSNNYFSQSPSINIGRSTFPLDHNVKTTFNAGDLIPFDVVEVLPGDTFDWTSSILCRMQPSVHPTMDTAFLDYYYFFVPGRLTWKNFESFFGESDPSAWTTPYDGMIPRMLLTGYEQGDLSHTTADYMGLPIINQNQGSAGQMLVNALPFRAYQLIWNYFFRDENLEDALLVSDADSVSSAEVTSLLKVQKVNKVHDYFTSSLPAPQKGPSVMLPPELLNTGNSVYPQGTPVIFGSNVMTNGSFLPASLGQPNFTNNVGVNSSGVLQASSGKLVLNATTPGSQATYLSNAYSAAGFSINDLRQAYAIQSLLERDARGGTRYGEILASHFGVRPSFAVLQQPEFLGGDRIYINMSQVEQTSPTSYGEGQASSPIGSVAGQSKTVNRAHSFTKSFEEHGWVIGVACVRTKHSYQYGLHRMWSRQTRYDFYYPELANIGEQPVMQNEIYFTDSLNNKNVFGYQEAWAEYRYQPDTVTGQFRHNAKGGSLDSWHYADVYSAPPTLKADWLYETSANIDRTLAVTSSVSDQFLCDMYFDVKATRPMPVYSIPGLGRSW